jgi:hypothetical protein
MLYLHMFNLDIRHNMFNIVKPSYAPDGVTRGTEAVTPGHALSSGLIVDGRHPHISINDGGRP